jgi:hypothetical protein
MIMAMTPIYGLSGVFGLDVVATVNNGSASTVIAPSVTTTRNAADLLVCIYCSATASAITVPGSQTAIATAATAANTVASAIGWENLAAEGATGTRTATSGAAASTGWSYAFSPSLGNIGTGVTPPFNPVRTVPSWPSTLAIGNPIVPSALMVTTRAVWFNALAGTYSLSGWVHMAGVPVNNCLVCLYERRSGLMIASTLTAADGTYSFTGLNKNVTVDNSFCISATDPNGLTTQYNSLEWDRLIPA